MTDLAVLILAAGKGERMQSELPKVLHPLGGIPLLGHVLQAAAVLKPKKVVAVIGHKAEEVRQAFVKHPSVQWVLQPKQLGTAHAVRMALPLLRGFKGRVLILYGDVPLLRAETLSQMLQLAKEKDSDVMLATTHLPVPTGYGRIVRNERGEVSGIVEEKEATPQQRGILEVNPGIYLVKAELLNLLSRIQPSAVKREYYLTDLIVETLKDGKKVTSYIVKDSDEVLGINTRVDLARVSRLLQQRVNRSWMDRGVTLVAPDHTWIETTVVLARDVVIHPGVVLTGQTRIASGAQIFSHSVIEDSVIESGARIGPFAHLRPGTVVGERSHIGNFVETKKAILQKDVKANHLSYLGDVSIGSGTNVGAGTITCNYDGKKKHRTEIGKNVFIGSDTQLVAPVKVGDRALIGAGTTVTKDVPAGSLVLSRVSQVNVGKKRK